MTFVELEAVSKRKHQIMITKIIISMENRAKTKLESFLTTDIIY